MGELEVRLRGKSLADYTNTQLRMALGAVLYTNTADMWNTYLKSLGYSGSVSAMLEKYYVDYAIPSQFRNYINAGAAINNPQNLFVDGSKGYIYDNNDLTSFYLDSAGTTAATVNGLVGLQLDKSGGLALGSELRALGVIGLAGSATVATYNTGTGVGTVTRVDAANQSYVQWSGLSANAFYKITLQNTGGGGQNINIRSGDQGAATAFTVNFGTTVTGFAQASAGGLITITAAGAATVPFTLQSIALLSGNHRYQATTGNKPILRGTPVGGNIVTNGDFASGTTGWVASANATVSNVANRLRIAAISNGIDAYASLAFSTTIGKVYRTTVQYATDAGTGNAFIYIAATIGGAALVNRNIGSTTGTYVNYFTATSTTTYISLSSSSSILAGEYHEWDDVEIVDVSADAVTAPYALQMDGSDDFLRTASVNFATVTSDGLARRNLLASPTAFNNADWGLGTGGSISANSVIAPDGTTTADAYTWPTSTPSYAWLFQTVAAVSNIAHTYSIWVKRPAGSGNRTIRLAISDVTTSTAASDNFTVTESWQRIKFTRTASTNTGFVGVGFFLGSAGTSIAIGEVIDVWGAQLETGTTESEFQDIGTDKATVCHGVRKFSDAVGFGMIVELSADSNSNNGSFYILGPNTGGTPSFGFSSKGTSQANYSAGTGYPAPFTAVLAMVNSISTDSLAVRVNGVQLGIAAGDQGTGNFGNYPFYFGRRGGVSLPFNGLDFGGVCIGKTLTATELANVEKWVARRTGVAL